MILAFFARALSIINAWFDAQNKEHAELINGVGEHQNNASALKWAIILVFLVGVSGIGLFFHAIAD